MKNFKFAIAALAIACALAISAFATATINFDIVKVNDDGLYKIVATAVNEGGKYTAFKADMTFNYDIIKPANKSNGNLINIATSTTSKAPVQVTNYYDDDAGEDVYAVQPQNPQWSVTGSTATLVVEQGWVGGYNVGEGLMMMEMSFKFADGKSIADLKAGDFVVDYVKYADLVTKEETFNHPTNTNTLTVVNNVIPAIIVDLEVPVEAGDVIYLQDGTVVTADVTGDYTLPDSADGYVVINKGYTSQKVYKVEAGQISECADYEDGVLGTQESSLRDDSKATGLRFKATFAAAIKPLVNEYGFLITVGMPAGMQLTKGLVAQGKAISGVAYNAQTGTDIFYSLDADRIVVTLVAIGIPLTKEAVTANMTVRPYYELADGATVYGEPTTRQVYEVARAIKQNDATTYAKYQTYIDSILALVPASESEAYVDLGDLFAME
ncbi:MAG: hypothetical protein K6D98_01450 [Clostridiales bacterium]|nr:hypothetical protein [Clostridiales bacterium]